MLSATPSQGIREKLGVEPAGCAHLSEEMGCPSFWPGVGVRASLGRKSTNCPGPPALGLGSPPRVTLGRWDST